MLMKYLDLTGLTRAINNVLSLKDTERFKALPTAGIKKKSTGAISLPPFSITGAFNDSVSVFIITSESGAVKIA